MTRTVLTNCPFCTCVDDHRITGRGIAICADCKRYFHYTENEVFEIQGTP